MNVIRKGDRGEIVKTLQTILSLVPDGIFGPLTEEAVKEFQKANHLTPDGIVGSDTWNKLLFSCNATVAPVARAIKEIIVHCSATPEGENYTAEQIRRMHLQRGFSDIGYHYVVYLDGTVKKGREESVVGAHCSGHNACSIGVCYIGGCPPRSEKDWAKMWKDTRTPKQKLALTELLAALKRKYPKAVIRSHRDFANKACPSFDATSEYKDL